MVTRLSLPNLCQSHSVPSLLKLQTTRGIEYEAVVEKRKDIGLGINVVEDRMRRAIIVQTVQEEICIQGLTAEVHTILI